MSMVPEAGLTKKVSPVEAKKIRNEKRKFQENVENPWEKMMSAFT